MKKLSFVMCALALAGVLFTGCKKNEQKSYDDIVENGFFIVGDAVGIQDLTDSRVVDAAMTPGTNEVTKSTRDGMYEKYVLLEGGKNFQFVKKEGNQKVYYGADLQAKEIETDGTPANGFGGNLAENVQMQVAESGMYHIIMDFNVNGDIPAQEIILVPVEWAICGGMNGWSSTVSNDNGAEYQAQTAFFTWNEVSIDANTEFKFRHGNCWKYQLDELGNVKAENSLGKDMVSGGENIKVESSGVYTIKLSFKMAGGEIAKSFTMELNKTGEVGPKDPATFVAGVSGAGLINADGTQVTEWADPVGSALAVYNASASSVTDPTTKAGTYVYDIANLTINGDFKFRYKGDWIGTAADYLKISGVDYSGEDNITLKTFGSYNIKITVAWDGEKVTEYKAEFSAGTPAPKLDYVDGYFYVNAGSYFAAAPNIYSWSEKYGNLFGNWPGVALETKDGANYKVAYHAVKDAAYKVIINGTEGQTEDSNEITLTGQDVLVTVGAKAGEKFAITVANK